VEGRSNFINFNGQAITRFMEKGDFVRIQNIVLGYRIPASILGASQNFPVRSVRIFAQAQNPFTFSSYTGLDPELNLSNTTNQQFGVDNNTNPILRIYTLGINIGL
jgi:TonB-dependent starch-binding outer membrane protein SusC